MIDEGTVVVENLIRFVRLNYFERIHEDKKHYVVKVVEMPKISSTIYAEKVQKIEWLIDDANQWFEQVAKSEKCVILKENDNDS